jgi:hypothetical protein
LVVAAYSALHLAAQQHPLLPADGAADCPDYVVIEDDERLAAAVGARWQTWLEQKGDTIRWRDPLVGDDILLWR